MIHLGNGKKKINEGILFIKASPPFYDSIYYLVGLFFWLKSKETLTYNLLH